MSVQMSASKPPSDDEKPRDPLAPIQEFKEVAPAPYADIIADATSVPSEQQAKPQEPIVPAKPWWRQRRPKELKPEKAEEILSSLEAGTSLRTAALSAGVAVPTLDRWLRMGREDDEKGKGTVYAHFFRACDEATAKCEDRYVTIIANQAQSTWSAAAWMLERKFPARYGARVMMTVEQELSGALEKLRKKLSPKEYEHVLEILSSDQYVEALQSSASKPELPPASEQTVEVGEANGTGEQAVGDAKD